MQLHRRVVGRIVTAACAVSVTACGGGGSNSSSAPTVQRAAAGLTDTALVSNGVIAAAHTDTNLLNAWGLASQPGGVFWVADNNSNRVTVYDGTGAPQAQVVNIPAGSNGPANPTGQIFNSTVDFLITTSIGAAPAQLILAGEGGTITAWARSVSADTASIAYDDGAGGASTKVWPWPTTAPGINCTRPICTTPKSTCSTPISTK